MKTYDPSQVQVIIGGNIMSGYADGTFISVERDENSFTKHVGTDGDVSRSKTSNKSGTMTLTLAQTSLSNDILSALHLADELSNNGVVPVMIKDNSGTTLLFAGESWIQKPANTEFSNEITDREWIMDLAIVEMLVGGNG